MYQQNTPSQSAWLLLTKLYCYQPPRMVQNKLPFIRKHYVVISRQSPFAANSRDRGSKGRCRGNQFWNSCITNAVPKLVATATSLDPRSRLCLHWIAWPWKPTPRIKQRVASCDIAADVISIQSLPSLPPHQGDSRSQRWVGDPRHVWYLRLLF